MFRFQGQETTKIRVSASTWHGYGYILTGGDGLSPDIVVTEATGLRRRRDRRDSQQWKCTMRRETILFS